MSKEYDVVVIGAGPAGYVAAIRCAQLGLKTFCVDRFKGKDGKQALGGTCLNIGCIPSKALLDSTKHYHHMSHEYASHGISFKDAKIDVPTMIGRKDRIVKQLTGGIAQLFKANKVDAAFGSGKLLKDNVVEITTDEETYTVKGKHVILASGSVPVSIPNVDIDNEYILDNAGGLDVDTVPEKLGVIGAGVIGLELGSVWNRLGSEVTVFEAMDTFLAACDQGLAKMAHREFKKQGLDIHLSTFVKSAEIKDGKVEVVYEKDGKKTTATFDKLLVAVGRRAETDGLLSDDCGVTLTDRGQIEVDEHCRTSAPNVWGIGDAVRGPMLAHKGSEEGVAVAARISGGYGHVDFNTIPWVIYTEPEIAWVGKTEEQLKEAGIEYKVGSFPFAANGRALAMNSTTGMVKILADADTDELLGAHILHAHASDLLQEIVVAMEFKGCAEDIASIVHGHPTLSEAVFEAAMHVDKKAIHRAN